MPKGKHRKASSKLDAQPSVETMRHSAAHVLAQAVLQLYPGAKLAIGPVIEDGFYYDFDLGEGRAFLPTDLPKLEKAMEKIVAQNQKFERYEAGVDESIEYLRQKGQPYKLELAEELKAAGETTVSFYRNTDPSGKIRFFNDLCKGPHVSATKDIGPFALTKIAGAYWRGDASKPMLQRIYGVAFAIQAELDQYLERRKLAEERDHRKLGVTLDLFAFSDLVGGGLPLFTPRGTIIRNELERYLEQLQLPRGYQKVWIPHLAKRELYQTSGHWEKFADDIFHVRSRGEEAYVLKPMNCPHHIQIYASRQRSYRELPLRYFEVTEMYRDEKPGQLLGLSRVRAITIDDAHCFCRLDQVEAEVNTIYDIIEEFYRTFQMELTPRLSLRDRATPERYLGGAATWDRAEATLRGILKRRVKDFTEISGEAAFYGPKIDFEAKDALGRKWQLATIQLDFAQPERFQLEYTDERNQRARPVMIHRAVSGSLERFLAILIENYGGAFPLWISPDQVVVATVGEKFNSAAEEFAVQLRKFGIRVGLDLSADTVNRKVRNAELQKAPYVLVFGEKEEMGDQLIVRVRGKKEVRKMSRAQFTEHVKKIISQRSLEL